MTWLYTPQWAAGFFDGEGCISIHRRLRGNCVSFDMTVQMTQNDVRPLEEVRARFGGVICKPRSEGKDRCHRWRAQGGDADAFLASVRPWLLVKAQAADLAQAVRALTWSKDREARELAYRAFRDRAK